MGMSDTKRSCYFPTGPLNDKHNYKRVFRIERDGSITERVFLDVADTTKRERLICIHYLRHLNRHFMSEAVGLNIVSRDAPWDFRLELSTGQKFNLEITAVADGPQHFEINKREERLTKWSTQPTMPLHELEKLNVLFPDPAIGKHIENYKSKAVSKSDLIENPFLSVSSRILLSRLFEPVDTLQNQIRTAVSKKMEKSHSGKEETVLIIDNRTCAFDVSDYFTATDALEPFINSTSFPEIWFYTGYCSDDDGNNAEFSFSPLKTTSEQAKVLEKLADSGAVDANDRVVW